MFGNQSFHPVDLIRGQPVAPCKSYWVKPVLGLAIVTFDVDMGRLVAIASVEEQSVGAASKYGGHVAILRLQAGRANMH